MGTPHFCGRVRLDCPAPPDRELHGGGPGFLGAGISVRVLALSNPAFDRVTFSLGDGQDSALTVPARNHRFCTGPVVSLLAGPDSASGKAGAFVS